jgi:hypothetical protein
MRGVRTLLTGFLLVAAFLLSFGALRHRALTTGIIHGDLGLPLVLAHVTISAHTLAGVWALTLDGLTAVGVLGVRDPELRDWRAWAALIGGLGLSLRFQVSGYDSWEARGMAAVPPLALAMAVWIFEVGRARPAPAAESAAQPLPVPATRLGPPAGSSGHDQTIPPDAQIISSSDQGRPKMPARQGGLTDQQRARVAAWRAEDPPRSARWIAGQLGLSNHARSKHLAPLIEQLQVARVGGPADNGSGPA